MKRGQAEEGEGQRGERDKRRRVRGEDKRRNEGVSEISKKEREGVGLL